jgi:hypothetical protein
MIAPNVRVTTLGIAVGCGNCGASDPAVGGSPASSILDAP